jgi:hypothetical protein
VIHALIAELDPRSGQELIAAALHQAAPPPSYQQKLAWALETTPSLLAGESPWLFPGGQPGRPISTAQLTQRLNELGIRPNQARSTALFQLATEIPAAILARTLGIHTDVAVAWQRLSAGDWATYAAEVSRRTTP